MLHIKRAFDAIGGGAPHAETLGAGFPLTRQEFGDAGAVVGEGIDAGETLGDKLLLEPEAAFTLHHINLGEEITVPVEVPPGKSELHLPVGGKGR